jgi:hypothetical protein
LVTNVIQDAASFGEPSQLALDLVFFSIEEHFGEKSRWRLVCRDPSSGPRPRQPQPFARQGQTGESRLLPDLLRRELIDGDPVTDPRLPRPRDPGQESVDRLVPAADPR